MENILAFASGLFGALCSETGGLKAFRSDNGKNRAFTRLPKTRDFKEFKLVGVAGFEPTTP